MEKAKLLKLMKIEEKIYKGDIKNFKKEGKGEKKQVIIHMKENFQTI